jgi:aspartyl/asparaginyl beta-hydroxylase (cupin superfamily)
MPATTTPSAPAGEIESRALAAEREHRFGDALGHWRQLLQLEPGHVRALTACGFDALRQGRLAEARELLTRAAANAPGDDPTPWVNVARVCRQQGDAAAEEQALFRALSIDPCDLLALLLRGQLFERQGRVREAAQAYTAAVAVAPPPERLRPDLQPLVAHATEVRDRQQRHIAERLDAALAEATAGLAPQELKRFHLAVDIMLGRKRRFDPQPAQFYLPGVTPTEFFDRAQFPWLDAFEAATEAIRDEFLAALRDDEGFAPYLTYGADQPLNQFAELNQSTRWSAYHLIKDGRVVKPAAAKCPRTMELLARAPQPDQPGRTPVALFSLLRPRTRIPPHTGVSNARLLVHLPLIIPPGCGFRVGNQTREWVPGQAWVFDDTMEHEAWNDSDQLRVILIFDIWHPSLSTVEQRLMTGLSRSLNDIAGMPAGYGA